MKLKLIVKRTARRGGSIGLGLRWLLPVPTIVGAASVALESELQLDLLLWQARVKYTSGERRNYQVW